MDVRGVVSVKTQPVLTIDVRSDLGAAAALLAQHQVGGLPVVEDGRLRGFIAESDIVAALARHGAAAPQIPVRDAMRRAPTCSPDESLTVVMGRMTRDRLRHLVVIDGDTITGILSVGDIVKHRLHELETEREVLRDYVAAQRAGA